MTDPTLQAYYDAHDRMISWELKVPVECAPDSFDEIDWAIRYGFYKTARYNAVKAGLIPEQPQFDVEDGR